MTYDVFGGTLSLSQSINQSSFRLLGLGPSVSGYRITVIGGDVYHVVHR